MRLYPASRHTPRKRFGQHFLRDPFIIRAIVEAIAPCRDDHMVEIGPGFGALTLPLLERLDALHVIEIDRDIVASLRASSQGARLIIHEGDVLAFDFASLAEPMRVVGNLPYNISTPILFHMAQYARRIADAHFMLQQEVVDRMVAAPSTKAYGRLSVMLQYRFEMSKVLDVPSIAFRPSPKVESAVVRMIPRAQPTLAARDEALLGRVVTAAFTKRRKTLRNALEGFVDAFRMEALGIDPALRPENLHYEHYVRIANACAG